MIGSLTLHMGGTPAMNGKTDTVGSLSTCSNTLIPRGDKVTLPHSSKFSKPRAESIDINGLK